MGNDVRPFTISMVHGASDLKLGAACHSVSLLPYSPWAKEIHSVKIHYYGNQPAKYIIHFEANAESWPTGPATVLALWEGVVPAATALLDAGTVTTIDWTGNTEGYATLEANSKAGALEVTAAFFPLFSQAIEEVAPWAETTAAILAGARAAAGG